MAGYTRQSTFSDGDTITAAIFNNEYNQVVNAFHNQTGHKHDGTLAEGPVIGVIGDSGQTTPLNKVLIDSTNDHIEFWIDVSSSSVQQFYVADGVIAPVTDSDIDLGTSSLYWKDAYIDSITTTGNVGVGGNLTVTGTTTFNGGTLNLGDSASDNIVFGGEVDSHIIPDDDGTFDLGSSTKEWRDIFIDGTAHIDTLDVDANATVAGTLGVTGVFTGSSLDISGNIDVDGVTNLDVVDIDGAVDMASTLTVAGVLTGSSLDISGDIDVDGTTNLDVVDIDGAVDMASNLAVGGNITVAGDLTVNGSTTTLNTATLDVEDKNITLNKGAGDTSGSADGAGITIQDAVNASNNATLLWNAANDNFVFSHEIVAPSLDISGNVDIDGTLEADAITVNGTTLSETISDTVGAMVGSNTESGITVSYDDSDNTLDFVIGTLNQDTTGNAATATALETARTISGVSFNGTSNITLQTSDIGENVNLYYTDARVRSNITGSELDMGGNKVLFGNLYSAEGDLPSASTYHGMFAHVHGTGKGYFAHAGGWKKLLDESSSDTADLTEGTNLYYTVARANTAIDARVTQSMVSSLGFAPLASPTFTGTPTAPTAANTVNTTQLATTAFVTNKITNLIGGAPGTLDTLNELAAAINDDSNYNSTLTTSITGAVSE